MHLFKMKGAWGGLTARLYNAIVAGGIGDLYEQLVDFLLTDLPDDSRLLDLGCGGGHTATALARRRREVQVVGVDLSPAQVIRATKRGGDLPNLRFDVDDAMDLGILSDRFDVVYSVASIKHWPDALAGIREMRRVCKPGGRVVLIEADKESTDAEARNFTSRWRFFPPGFRWLARWYFRRFVAAQGSTLGELTELIKQAGLRLVETRNVEEQPLIAVVAEK